MPLIDINQHDDKTVRSGKEFLPPYTVYAMSSIAVSSCADAPTVFFFSRKLATRDGTA
jgi:hypothetical protein